MTSNNRVAVITGSAQGIGKSVATAFAEKGLTVVIADVNQKEGLQTAKEIEESHGQVMFSKTDVRSPSDIIHLMQSINERYGRIDVLINNAGISRWTSPYELTVEDWDNVLNTNLRSQFLCSREAAKIMKKNTNGGAIVNIASTRGLMSEPNSEAYAASKGGIIALTHALAASFSKDRISVNAISPGWIETGDYEKLSEKAHQQHLSRRVGQPQDIARTCLFLTDPENDFITGENIVVDGGMTKKMIYI